MQPVAITAITATSCLGAGLRATSEALRAQRSGLAPCNFETVQLDTYIGQVPGIDERSLPSEISDYECRNNRLALLGLKQDGFMAATARAVDRYGAERVGVFLGTSTAGMLETEIAFRSLDANGMLPASFKYAGSLDFYSLASFVRKVLSLQGPAAVVSTACSSSAKVFGMARRYMQLGIIDAAVVGGVDSLCLTTMYGFHSLQLTSPVQCRPFDKHRDGISVGEAAAFALLEVMGDSNVPGTLALLGVGETSDAHHISSPHPEGAGARSAMQAALADAELPASAVDYINLHGTGTPSNDGAESKAVEGVLGTEVPCSSTKGYTGHTLGAAGALEIAICAIAVSDGFMPSGLNCTLIDPECRINYLRSLGDAGPRVALSNSLGFGGTNCSVVIGRLK
jgi:3-oxoacyl-[acyl-carrier-protein] synthase-1